MYIKSMGMGNLKDQFPSFRRVDDLFIVFGDRQTVYVFVRNAKMHIVFHRWWQGRGSYTRWHLFSLSLKRRKTLDVKGCHEVAAKHGIEYQYSIHEVVIKGKKYDFNSKEE